MYVISRSATSLQAIVYSELLLLFIHVSFPLIQLGVDYNNDLIQASSIIEKQCSWHVNWHRQWNRSFDTGKSGL